MSVSNYPRVLVISHNVFSNNGSMGRTLSTYFNGWPKDKIAQLYFHSGVPTNHICHNIYRITDIDALKSIIKRYSSGDILTEKDIDGDRINSDDTDGITKVYDFGRKRFPITYILRDTVRRVSGWKNKKFLTWLDDFMPEVIFLASGDYEFPYFISLDIAKRYNIPLVVCCFDDYYLYNKNEKSFLGRLRQHHFMGVVHRTMQYASYIFTFSDAMSEAYKKLFSKPCAVLYTATNLSRNMTDIQERQGISYLGGLGLNRYKQLIDIGMTLKNFDDNSIPKYIDVYSGETDSSILKNMTLENGINFHGMIPQKEVPSVIEHSMAVVHTESFDEDIMKRVMYSISTKIPDSLAMGTCLLAYGPKEVSSIDYLIRNDAAFVATNKEELKQRVREIFESEDLRKQITSNAIALAKKNHDKDKIPMQVKEVLLSAISDK